MKKVTILICSLVLSFGGVGMANATSFTLDNISVQLNQQDPGLVVWWLPISTSFTFALDNVGDSVTKDLFRIGTNETWSNSDDRVDLPIRATFGFSSPKFSVTNTGNTSGHAFLFASWGSVEWNDPVFFNFGTSGQISIDLSDRSFWTPGSANISGKIALTKIDVTPVPEPGTLLTLGFVLLGLVAVSRKRFTERS